MNDISRPASVMALFFWTILPAATDQCPQQVAQGLIPHWVEVAFIPRVSVNDVLAIVHDYDRYKDFYAPNLVDTKRLERAPFPEKLDQRFSLLWVRKILFVTRQSLRIVRPSHV